MFWCDICRTSSQHECVHAHESDETKPPSYRYQFTVGGLEPNGNFAAGWVWLRLGKEVLEETFTEANWEVFQKQLEEAGLRVSWACRREYSPSERIV